MPECVCQPSHHALDPLTEEEAWNLFTRQLGYYDHKVEPLAKSVARECAGLPLGIQTMARSMMGVDDIHEWRNVLRELTESKVRQDDMEPEVFRILKCSYIRLNDSTLQQSFLYCALFPEDFALIRENLIEYLIDEKIIEEMRSRHAQIDKGHSILNKLENVCLLESPATDGRQRCVKMHDLMRDMALQKLRENFQGMVAAGEQLEELPDEEKWTEDLMRVSLMKNQIKEIPSGHSPKCPNLSTLLLSMNYELTMIADSFFTRLCGLKVLDLSFTNIARLPDSISDLVTLAALLLQNCSSLRLVPSLAKLRALKKLDLRYTGIQEVPQGMACLSNLRYLNLHETWLKELPAGILPNLFRLQFLRLPKELVIKGEEVACLRKLETLECHFSDLVNFSAYFKDKERQSLSAYSFRIGVTESVYACGYKSLRGSEDFRKEVWLHNFSLRREGDFLRLPEDIEDLEIAECNDVKTLSDFFPLQYAKQLKSFSIERCDGMKYLFSLPAISTGIPESLETLKLKLLTNLVALISRDIAAPLPIPSFVAFSCLKKFEIYCCQGIEKLFHPGLLPNFQNLEVLEVADCDKLKVIVATEELIMSEASHIRSINGLTITSTEFSLPKLKVLSLTHLPELTSIYYGKIICDSLQEITLLNCPKLKRMPLSLLLLNNGGQSPLPSIEKIVIHTKRWWETVEWDQPNAKNVLLPLCVFFSDDEDEIEEEDVTDAEDEIDQENEIDEAANM